MSKPEYITQYLSLDKADLHYLHDSIRTCHGPFSVPPDILFATTSHSKSDMNREVEDFLIKKTLNLPR